MTFREWCRLNWGLVNFTEGKIQNSVLIPALPNALISLSPEMEQYGGYLIENSYIRAVILPADNYYKLKLSLKHNYSTKTAFFDSPVNRFIESHFSQHGLNIRDEREYKEASYIYFHFDDIEKKEAFLIRFSYLFPLISANHATSLIIQFPPYAIKILLDTYYDGLKPQINLQALEQIQHQHNKLNQLLIQIDQYHLRPRLDYASLLSRDYSNSAKNGVYLHSLQAISAYSMSLKVYAELNRDNLSPHDYLKLNYAAALLAVYDEAGHLKQSLKTDAKFVRDMNALFFRLQKTECIVPLRQLSSGASAELMRFIDQDIYDSLYGNPLVSLGKNAYFRKARFLPDAQMHSNTDELILIGGGRAQHFAVYRIIKVGFLVNGLKAGMDTSAHFYKYYKVENNLGCGTHVINTDDNTCYGTYITELSPMQLTDGIFTPVTVNPCTHPRQYQAAMAFTLVELIRAERELLFYQDANLNPLQVNDETAEWRRLHAIAVALSGTPVNELLEYLSHDPFDSTLCYERDVCNMKDYMQQGGSCTIFSLKSLVSSVMGKRLTLLHINFMQLNNAQLCLNAVEHKINQLSLWHSSISSDLEQVLLTNTTMSVDEPIPSVQHHLSFVMDNRITKEELIKRILLSEDETICLITQINNAATEESSFELACPNSDGANQLLAIILDVLPEDVFISRADNIIELSLYCMQMLCELSDTSYEELIAVSKIDTINADDSNFNMNH